MNVSDTYYLGNAFLVVSGEETHRWPIGDNVRYPTRRCSTRIDLPAPVIKEKEIDTYRVEKKGYFYSANDAAFPFFIPVSRFDVFFKPDFEICYFGPLHLGMRTGLVFVD